MDALAEDASPLIAKPNLTAPLPHATGAKHRLHRDLTGRFGLPKWAMHEVIVELTGSLVMADLGTRP
jgi:antirestriction protein ArdC